MTTTTHPPPASQRPTETVDPPEPPSSADVLRLVTTRELRTRGTSRAYQLSALIILLLLTGAIVVPRLLASRDVRVDVGVLGEGSAAVVELARDNTAAEMADRDRELRYVITAFEDEAAATAALEAGDVELVVLHGSEILRAGSGGFDGSDTEAAVQDAAAQLRLRAELDGSSVAVEDVTSLLRSEPLTVRSLRGAADAEENTARSLIAYGGMMLLYMAILTYGNWTLQGVTEEKSSRVVEVLLATVKPWQLMAGKILGVGLLGLGQLAITIVWALLLIRVTDAFPLPMVPVDSAITLVVWFVLGFGLYSVLYAAAGALAGSMEDAQAVSFPISLVAIVGFLVSFQVLEDPSSGIARVMTHVPLTSPFVAPIRVAYGELPLWEHAVAALISIGTTVLLVRIAGRLYAGGLLHFSGRMRLRAAWRSESAGG